jgi:hypothetical protein
LFRKKKKKTPYLIANTKKDGGKSNTNMLAPVVLAFPKTRARTARIIAKNVDIEADRAGGREGRETKNPYDPSESLGARVSRCTKHTARVNIPGQEMNDYDKPDARPRKNLEAPEDGGDDPCGQVREGDGCMP